MGLFASYEAYGAISSKGADGYSVAGVRLPTMWNIRLMCR
jgi:hypothetical protein